jgi:hypothetical protein
VQPRCFERNAAVRAVLRVCRHYAAPKKPRCASHYFGAWGKHTPERCVEAAFRFLLDREPKEAILRRFDVTVISRYLPEFEQELPRYLARSCAWVVREV